MVSGDGGERVSGPAPGGEPEYGGVLAGHGKNALAGGRSELTRVAVFLVAGVRAGAASGQLGPSQSWCAGGKGADVRI